MSTEVFQSNQYSSSLTQSPSGPSLLKVCNEKPDKETLTMQPEKYFHNEKKTTTLNHNLSLELKQSNRRM